MQLIIASHSPLVLASAEPIFDKSVDKLFHLEQTTSGRVDFNEIPFQLYGEVGSWLMSNVFQLKHARSREAEEAISDAVQLQLETDPGSDDIKRMTERLAELLPAEDRFWPRWVFFAKQHGVEL